MPIPSTDNDRVARTLAWGICFSLCFHAILFSPQLADLLTTKPAEAEAAAAKDAKDPKNKTDEQKKAEEKKGEKKEKKQGEKEEAEKPPENGAQKPPPPPGSQDAPPIETPKPSPAYPDVEDTSVGEDKGDAMSVVIIGRDDYEEHMAQLSVVSQAGYRMSDAGGNGEQNYGRGSKGDGGGGGGAAPNATVNTVVADTAGTPSKPDTTVVAAAEPVKQPEGPPVPPEPAKPVEPPPTPTILTPAVPKDATPAPPSDATVPPPPTPPLPPTPEPVTTNDPNAQPANPPVETPRDPKAPKPEEPKPVPPAERLPVPVKPDDTAKTAAPTTPAAPVLPKPETPAIQPPAAQPGGGIASTEKPRDGSKTDAPGESGKAGGSGPSPTPGTGGEGDLKDLESPATSTTQVDPKLWKNGRLVAAQGVQLKPRKPQFTMLQQVSSLPNCRPPVVSLTFDSTGKCVDVFFNRSSGDSEIDGVLKNSLYFWRAAGKKIDDLKGTEKVRITLQLLF